MYIRDQASSELDWAGAYARGRTGLGATFGADTRQRVRDAGKAPYRWICALDQFFPYKGSLQLNKSTGFLISPRHVLTAAHNVFPLPGIEAKSITVTPGLDGTKLLGNQRAPAGSKNLTPGLWWVPSQYRTQPDSAWDFALLSLPSELPPVHGMTYGHWADARYTPKTTISPVSPCWERCVPVRLSRRQVQERCVCTMRSIETGRLRSGSRQAGLGLNAMGSARHGPARRTTESHLV